jgi:hypothetical protein
MDGNVRLKPTKGQRWRVSVYPPGVTDNVPTDYPLIHKASREQATAQAHYDHYARQIGNGKIGRVIMHQGKLYMGSSQYMHNDTQWGIGPSIDKLRHSPSERKP